MPSNRSSTHPLLTALERGYRETGVTGGVLLAVSGGADSTALLLGTAQLAEALGLRPEVACLDHGFRPEAASEVAWVGTLAGRLNFPFHSRHLGLGAGPAVEERARQARYAALEVLRTERGLGWVVTAHTANDQAETLLMRLARGAALKGAAGVLARRERIVRPLLDCTRSEVEDFLCSEGQGFVRDPMNADPAFLRTRIRGEVLPRLISEAGAATVRHLAGYARLAGEDEAMLSALADEAWRRLQVGPEALDLTGVRALLGPLRRRVLARLIGQRGLTVDLAIVRRALEAVERGGRAGLAGGWELRCAGGTVRCVRPESIAVPPPRAFGVGDEVRDPTSGLCFRLVRQQPSEDVAPGEEELALDAEVALPLTLRRRQPGDRVEAGPRGGTRKLQDLLVDLKIRAEDRDLLPVIADGRGRILWVAGAWKAPPKSASGLLLRLRRNDS
ncbi:MAG TPA: tRNA lysidine(34) synthetase TilS [Myxococcaceae bacterium]|nr:tRNA lysidine(34) synthetase TilS [Myxococcaceae bacterium]